MHGHPAPGTVTPQRGTARTACAHPPSCCTPAWCQIPSPSSSAQPRPRGTAPHLHVCGHGSAVQQLRQGTVHCSAGSQHPAAAFRLAHAAQLHTCMCADTATQSNSAVQYSIVQSKAEQYSARIAARGFSMQVYRFLDARHMPANFIQQQAAALP
eukprot:1150903-Pelagomonas_calceolata.AAC.5